MSMKRIVELTQNCFNAVSQLRAFDPGTAGRPGGAPAPHNPMAPMAPSLGGPRNTMAGGTMAGAARTGFAGMAAGGFGPSVFGGMQPGGHANNPAAPMPGSPVVSSGSVRTDAVHQRMRGFIEEMRTRATEAGFPPADVDDITYAIVALVDEIGIGRPDPIGSFWMGNLLQVHYFSQNVAGDEFFTRLDVLLQQPQRADVLIVYYLCLLFGFQGRYSRRGGEVELMKLTDNVKRVVDRELAPPDALSPAGDRPAEHITRSGDRNPLLWLSAAAVLIACGIGIAFRVLLDSEADVLVQKLAEFVR